MPSLTEPCGLSQLICYRYGVVPIVNSVGGLFDTVKEYSNDTTAGTGFVLKEYSENGLVQVVQEVIKLYDNKKKWNELVKRLMLLNFSWDNSAKEYIKIYKFDHSQKRGHKSLGEIK